MPFGAARSDGRLLVHVRSASDGGQSRWHVGRAGKQRLQPPQSAVTPQRSNAATPQGRAAVRAATCCRPPREHCGALLRSASLCFARLGALGCSALRAASRCPLVLIHAWTCKKQQNTRGARAAWAWVRSTPRRSAPRTPGSTQGRGSFPWAEAPSPMCIRWGLAAWVRELKDPAGTRYPAFTPCTTLMDPTPSVYNISMDPAPSLSAACCACGS